MRVVSWCVSIPCLPTCLHAYSSSSRVTCVQVGGVTEMKYLRWFKRQVVPILNRWDPINPAKNSIVCLDNVNLQHSPRFMRLLRRCGVKVFHFARYDPTLSPIEKAFNQV